MTTDTDDLDFYVREEDIPQIPNIGSTRLQSLVLDAFERQAHANQTMKARHSVTARMALEALMTYVAELEGKP